MVKTTMAAVAEVQHLVLETRHGAKEEEDVKHLSSVGKGTATVPTVAAATAAAAATATAATTATTAVWCLKKSGTNGWNDAPPALALNCHRNTKH